MRWAPFLGTQNAVYKGATGERQCNLLNVLRCSRPLPSPTFSWAVTFVGVVWFELSSKCAKTLFSSLSSICKIAGVHVTIVASPLSPLIHLFREASRITLFRAGEHSSFVVKQDALSSLCRDNGLLAIEYCHAIAWSLTKHQLNARFCQVSVPVNETP